MCTYVYVRFVIGIFSFFAPLGPLELIIVWHFPKKCGNDAIPQSPERPQAPDSCTRQSSRFGNCVH